MIRIFQISMMLVCIVLQACSTLSQTQCESKDWYNIGYLDGRDGRSLNRLDNHRDACSKYGIGIDGEQYRYGREKGILQYCTPESGLRAGQAGKAYYDVCPPELEPAFYRSYQFGYQYYELSEEIDDIDWKINDIEHKLDKDKLSDEKRKRLNHEVRSLYRERRALERALDALNLSYY